MDKIRAMDVFINIAEQGSLTAAAEVLGMTLPTVVRTLANLEEVLKVRLFNRTTRHVMLTEEGRLYLERSRRILADIEETESLLNQNQQHVSGLINITAPVRFGELFVAPAMTGFMRRYPDVQVNLLLLDRVVNLIDEGLDLAIRISHLNDSSLIAKPIGEIQQLVCASPAFIKKTGVPQHPDELGELPCVVFTGISNSGTWFFTNGKKNLSVKVNGKFYCNQIAASVEACIAGVGFGQFYSYQVASAIEKQQLVVVLSSFQTAAQPISLIYPHSRLLSVRIRSCLNWLESELPPKFTVSSSSPI